MAVLISIVAPIPPEATFALPVLNTETPDTLSEAISRKLKLRETPASCNAEELGIWRPFKVTKLKSGPKPRTVTLLPSLLARSMETPLIRCSDSAKLVSGNLPMSSAEMASTTPDDSCLIDADLLSALLIPVTLMTSRSASSAGADSCCA